MRRIILPGDFLLTHEYDIVTGKERFMLFKDGKQMTFSLNVGDPYTMQIIEAECNKLQKELDADGQHRGTSTPLRSPANPPRAPAYARWAQQALNYTLSRAGASAGAANAIAVQAASAVVVSALGQPSLDPLGLMAPLPPLPREEPKCGELVGHRCWYWYEAPERLVSYGVDCTWLPGVPMEDRTFEGKCIGDRNCVGVWSFKSADLLSLECLALAAPQIVGTCWHWGTVIEHAWGYRSQFAAIRSLDRASGHPDIIHPSRFDEKAVLQRVRQRYNVPEVTP